MSSPARALATPETQANKLSAWHVTALDGVRGLAVLMVVLYHTTDYMSSSGLILRAFRFPLRIGWSGVDLFFVLSGFLITGILLDTRESPRYFQSFYARRALRIFPLYYFVLTAVLVAARFAPGLNSILPIAHDRIFYFFYLNNWWLLLKDTWHANIIGHFWSLAVEEQFYLWWSLCVFLIPPKYILRVAAIGIVLALAIRCGIYAHAGMARDLVENSFARMDSLLAGAFLAGLVRRPAILLRMKRPIYLAGAISAVVALAIVYLIRSAAMIDVVAYSFLAMAFGALVLFAFLTNMEKSRVKQWLSDKRLTTVGKYSYGMYVYHVPLLAVESKVIRRFVHYETTVWGNLLFAVAILATTFLIAKLSFDLFESRFLQLKRYFRA